eukprot:TRINITY_DN8049_c0_g2_i1.p1 TRINITY_DN8049_c0_g2~~TRINITY_DN8049_c0_g2_i1.p1  ORF type:complete len:547 (+),score=265.77 TRINITY_DN8049_c0_g2_i1:119-1759(+)
MAVARGSGLDNPFRQPTDEEVFFMRDQERLEKEQLKSRMQYQKVHEKTTASARIGTASTTNVSGGPGDTRERSRRGKTQGYTPDYSREAQKDKENMADFIVKKREMGLIRMSLATKRAEIQKLESEAERAEKRIKQQEEQLEETSQKFDHFIKDNDMKAVEAMKKAEAESKGKNEKSGEIKKLNAYNAAVLTEKIKFEEQLNACLRYKHDLDRLTPDSWFRESLVNIRVADEKEVLIARVRQQHEELQAQAAAGEDGEEVEDLTDELIEQRVADPLAAFQKKITDDVNAMPLSQEDVEEGEEVELMGTVKGQLDAMDPNKVPMFFVDPDKILDIFVEIEENNLFLIQNCQETEQSLEELKAKYEESRQKMDKQVVQLKSQIEIERHRIAEKEARRKNLQTRSQMAKEARGQDELLEDIKSRVYTIYRVYMQGDDERGRDSLGIMTQIETKLEELKKYIDKHVPADTVASLMKQQDKQRRDRLRQEKRNRDRKRQQERADQVLERAFQSVTKRVGKPVMWRSKPEEKKRETTVQQEQQEEDGEEFFL